MCQTAQWGFSPLGQGGGPEGRAPQLPSPPSTAVPRARCGNPNLSFTAGGTEAQRGQESGPGPHSAPVTHCRLRPIVSQHRASKPASADQGDQTTPHPPCAHTHVHPARQPLLSHMGGGTEPSTGLPEGKDRVGWSEGSLGLGALGTFHSPSCGKLASHCPAHGSGAGKPRHLTRQPLFPQVSERLSPREWLCQPGSRCTRQFRQRQDR